MTFARAGRSGLATGRSPPRAETRGGCDTAVDPTGRQSDRRGLGGPGVEEQGESLRTPKCRSVLVLSCWGRAMAMDRVLFLPPSGSRSTVLNTTAEDEAPPPQPLVHLCPAGAARRRRNAPAPSPPQRPAIGEEAADPLGGTRQDVTISEGPHTHAYVWRSARAFQARSLRRTTVGVESWRNCSSYGARTESRTTTKELLPPGDLSRNPEGLVPWVLLELPQENGTEHGCNRALWSTRLSQPLRPTSSVPVCLTRNLIGHRPKERAPS